MPWLLAVVEFTAVAAGLCLIERLLPLDPSRARRRWTDRRSDARWFVLYLPVAVLFGGVSGWIVHRLVATDPTARGIGRLPFAVECTVSLAVYDLTAYWLHRTLHRVPRLWRWHAVHHRSVELRWWTTFRMHPAELALTALVPPSVAVLAGAGRPALTVTATAVAVVSLFGHLDAESPAGPIEHVLAVPGFHRRHHLRATESRNFAVVFSLFDHCFGTWTGPPQPAPGAALSADGEPSEGERRHIGQRGDLHR